MTMQVTIKRDNNPHHNAVVRIRDVDKNGTASLLEARTLGPGEEVSIYIWGTRTIDVSEQDRVPDEVPSSP